MDPREHAEAGEPGRYRALDAACEGLDTDAMLAFLHNFIDTLPSGKALSRRFDLD